MDDRTVSAQWLGDYRVETTAGPHTVPVDEPESVGGSGTGPMPTELLLSSVASCFVLAVAWSARKLDAALGKVTVEVTGRYDGPRFADLRITVRTDLADDVRDRVLESAQRVCYVTNTLRRPPEITIRSDPF